MGDTRDLIDHLIADWQREKPELDCASMGVVGRVIHLGMVLRHSAGEALASHGLTYTDLDILATLRRKGAPFELTPTELGSAVLLTSGAVTTAVARLVQRGLVSRGKNPSDARMKTVRLTEVGRALVELAIADRFREADEAISALDRGEIRELEAALRHLVVTNKRRSGDVVP